MAKCDECKSECSKSQFGKTLCFDCYLKWQKQDKKLNTDYIEEE